MKKQYNDILKRLIGLTLIFIGFYFLLSIFNVNNQNNESDKVDEQEQEAIILSSRENYNLYDTIVIDIKNNSDSEIYIDNNCPYPPFVVLLDNKEIKEATNYECLEDNTLKIEPKSSISINLGRWNHTMFDKTGEYTFIFETDLDDYCTDEKECPQIEINKNNSNFLSSIWDNLLYRPIYNILIYFSSIAPGYNLGIAIILLTILIRILILIPNQKAMESQKRLQKIQPKIKEIQNKYKGDQQKISQETMKLWKKEKVNPFGSCLPMLLQFPILIALYFAIRGSSELGNTILFYPFLSNFNLELVNPMFLGMNLSTANNYIIPIIVGVMQFIQIKLSMSMKQTKSGKDNNSMLKKQSNIMLILMPLMITYFAFIMPAGVGLYWGISTLFGIGQQLVVNKEKNI